MKIRIVIDAIGNIEDIAEYLEETFGLKNQDSQTAPLEETTLSYKDAKFIIKCGSISEGDPQWKLKHPEERMMFP